ncbi:WbqC-like protein family protein [Pedobacter steynii]|uniref:WbqC-like protein family protein n=1 Tax=Pedobacter steynii TaxID=430522 RepID=A0A1H0CG27_9SPHI|nr:WbqC family protein [Pedobacter steynii]NQX41557.1 WbqC family protein [Pedobacter steynii]SDN56773.1 WbqC-like protein family protein [Pedobacter steynii]
MQSLAIFPLFYLPPVSYFKELKRSGNEFLLEKEEHFPKQTFRNRATIYSPNGSLDLIVPVIRGAKVHTKIKDVKISNDFNWQRLHWKSLESCYRNSAYFEYYEDEFAKFYHQKFDFLFDYNLEVLQWLFKQLKTTASFEVTNEYHEIPAELDFRGRTLFKKPEGEFKPYFQVFDDREGFKPNLSIVDLLFNQGPQAKNYI